MILVMILMMTMMLLCSVVFVVYKMQPKNIRYVWWNWQFLRVSAAERAIRVSIHISFDNINVLFDIFKALSTQTHLSTPQLLNLAAGETLSLRTNTLQGDAYTIQFCVMLLAAD